MEQTQLVKSFKVFFRFLQFFGIQPINLSAKNSPNLKKFYMIWSLLHLTLSVYIIKLVIRTQSKLIFNHDSLGMFADAIRAIILLGSHVLVYLEVMWYHDEFIKVFGYLMDIEKVFALNFKYAVNMDEEFRKFYKLLRNLSIGFLVYYISVELKFATKCKKCKTTALVFFLPQFLIFIKQLQYWIYVKSLTIYLISMEKVLKDLVNYSCYNQRLRSLNLDKLIQNKNKAITVIYCNIQSITNIINKIFGHIQLIFVFKMNFWIMIDVYWTIMDYKYDMDSTIPS